MSLVALYLPPATALVIYFARLKEVYARREVIPGPILEHATFRAFFIIGNLTLFGALAEYFWRDCRLQGAAYSAGVLCALASFGLRRRAIASLGKFWSVHVEIRPNHTLVVAGPYRWMRHPAYFSMILESLSLALILTAIWPCIALMVMLIPAICWRIRIEEAALTEKFGDPYRLYKDRVPALLPYKKPVSK